MRDLDDDGEAWPQHEPNEIVPGLFQGGTPTSATGGHPQMESWGHPDFDLIVTLYASAHPAPWGVEELRFGFLDAELHTDDVQRVLRLATYAHERWASGDRVLVRCQAGLNRSGLVTSLILIAAGWPAEGAISRIRSVRSPHALSNPHFERWLILHGATALQRGGVASPLG